MVEVFLHLIKIGAGIRHGINPTLRFGSKQDQERTYCGEYKFSHAGLDVLGIQSYQYPAIYANG